MRVSDMWLSGKRYIRKQSKVFLGFEVTRPPVKRRKPQLIWAGIHRWRLGQTVNLLR